MRQQPNLKCDELKVISIENLWKENVRHRNSHRASEKMHIIELGSHETHKLRSSSRGWLLTEFRCTTCTRTIPSSCQRMSHLWLRTRSSCDCCQMRQFRADFWAFCRCCYLPLASSSRSVLFVYSKWITEKNFFAKTNQNDFALFDFSAQPFITVSFSLFLRDYENDKLNNWINTES